MGQLESSASPPTAQIDFHGDGGTGPPPARPQYHQGDDVAEQFDDEPFRLLRLQWTQYFPLLGFVRECIVRGIPTVSNYLNYVKLEKDIVDMRNSNVQSPCAQA